ncbi:hypothetical protein [Actinoplanes sp. NPDC026619]|uniref:hypothetical protein n=1 Tax=Actinoplanes sp. NPDC026619 TaxID=3155798 RepID=UPI0033CF17AB
MFPVATMAATVVAAVVVLAAGGPERVGLALGLLIGVPLLMAMGGGSDHALPDTPQPLGIRLISYGPPMLLYLTAVVVLGWQAIAGGVVCAVAMVPLAMVMGRRVWQFRRRLGAH